MKTYSDGNGGQVDTYGNRISYGENSYYDSVNQRPITTTTTAGSYGADTGGYIGMHSSGTGSGAITPGGGGGGYGMNSSGTGTGGIYGGGTYHDPYTTTGPAVIYHQQQSHIPSYTSPAGDYDGGVVHSTTTTTNDHGEKVQLHRYTREKKCCIIC